MRKYSKIGDILDKKDNDQKKPVAKKIIIGVIALIAVLVVLVGAFGYNYVKTALQPLDRNSNKQVEVKIPVGSTNKQIGAILEEKKVIKSGFVFDYYVRTNKLASFKAGYYELKPSMSLATIAKELQKGGASQPLSSGKVLVKEGVTIDEIGDVIAQTTKFKKQDFLALVNDESFLNELKAKYPELLTSALEAKDVRYRLEGYLYPATYAVPKNETLKQLVEIGRAHV